MVLSGSAAPLAAVDTDGSAGGSSDPAVHTAAAYVVLHCDLLCIGDSYHPKMRHFFHTGASHADTGVAVQQHFSGTLCRCHRHEFYPAACLWRHGHSVVFEQF